MIYSVKDGYSKKELQILMWVHELSYSQGFYGRLLDNINRLSEEDYEKVREDWNERFDDIVDFILYIEC